MKGKMILLAGLPGSGKSTWARNQIVDNPPTRFYRINWDELRIEMGQTGVFNQAQEEEAMKARSYDRVRIAVGAGVDTILVDNTNLTEGTRSKWEALAKELNLDYFEQWFGTPVEECVYRDSQREGKAQVGRAVIERMALWSGLLYLPPRDPELGAKNLIILDIDGTIADLTHRREILQSKCSHCLGTGYQPDPNLADMDINCAACNGKGLGKKDWYKFYSLISLDTPITPIVDLVNYLREKGYRIFVVSGRPISWGDLEIGKETVAWLKKHNIFYDHIFMRQGGDGREDTIVKQEILDKLPKNRIAYVLDDRDSVVKMWRENGLTCLQVAPGDF
jgi:predicted kinase